MLAHTPGNSGFICQGWGPGINIFLYLPRYIYCGAKFETPNFKELGLIHIQTWLWSLTWGFNKVLIMEPVPPSRESLPTSPRPGLHLAGRRGCVSYNITDLIMLTCFRNHFVTFCSIFYEGQALKGVLNYLPHPCSSLILTAKETLAGVTIFPSMFLRWQLQLLLT